MADVCFSKPEVVVSQPWILIHGCDIMTSYVDKIWLVDRFWLSDESDVITYETGSSIEPPLPPSWNSVWHHYCAAGWNLVAWWGIARWLLW